MKISEMIKNLQKFMSEHGDIECWYATDDEGNEYHKIYYYPSLYYINSDNEVYGSLDDLEIDEEDMEDEGVRSICVVN